ncbi:MAG: hypothetical protein AB8B53_08305 [Flavobacteriales bacterium]
MNALLEFILLAGISFFLFMFLAYKDATRTRAPKGMLAKLFDNLSFWKAEDARGLRGYLFRQSIVLKLVVALVGAALIRILYAIFFDFSIATETFNFFTGLSGYLLHAGIIVAAIYLSYMWPAVTERVVKVKDEAIKDRKEKAAEEAEMKSIQEAEPPIATQQKPTPEPQPKPKKDDPNDIINDYLK